MTRLCPGTVKFRKITNIMIARALRILWMLLGWLELSLLTLVMYPITFLIKHRYDWFTWLFRAWSRAWVHALGIDLRLHQMNKNPIPDQFILIANHPSAFEDIGIPALFNVDSLAKIEVRDWWILGRISVAAGTLFVHRESPESRKQTTETIMQRLAEHRSVALYPEGGIKGKKLHSDFRYGAFNISLKTGVPILPIFIHYEAQDDFHWSHQSLLRKILDFMLTRNNRANYYQFDAIDPGDFSDKQSYCDAVYQQYLIWQEKYLN